MRKLAYVVLLLAVAAIPSRAQSTHKAVLTWTASTDAAANPTLGYNVYKFQGTCPIGTTPTATKLNTSPVTATTYTDSGLTVGASVCYFVTSTLNGAESGPSASAGGTVPPAGVLNITVTVQ